MNRFLAPADGDYLLRAAQRLRELGREESEFPLLGKAAEIAPSSRVFKAAFKAAIRAGECASAIRFLVQMETYSETNGADLAWIADAANTVERLFQSTAIALPQSNRSELATQLGITRTEKVVGLIGPFSSLEDLDVAFDACNDLVQRGEELKLLILGEGHQVGGSYHRKYRAPWLIHTARLPHDKVADYYALLDAVVVPPKRPYEPEAALCMKAAESMFYGKRIVHSSIIPLSQGYDGMVAFEPNSAPSLASAIQTSLQQPVPKPTAAPLGLASPKSNMITGTQSGHHELEPFIQERTNQQKQLNTDFCQVSEKTNRKQTPWTRVSVSGIKTLSIRATSKVKIGDKKIILKIRFLNGKGEKVEPRNGEAYYSDMYGWFRYVPVCEEEGDSSLRSVDLPIPEGIDIVELSFVNLGEVDTDRFSASLEKKDGKLVELNATKTQHENVFNYLHGFSCTQASKAKAIIYGDVSPNVLDGSSIWLTSVTNIVSSTRPTILLLKDNVKNDKVTPNINRHPNLSIIEPKDIGFKAPLDRQTAVEALSLLHAHCPQVTALITRGVDISYEIQKRKEFVGILYPYLTDFYEVTESGFALNDSKVDKLRDIALNAKALLFQTDEIRLKIEEIVGYKLDGVKLSPTIPEHLFREEPIRANPKDTIHIGYAGKVQPMWGVAELIDEVEKQILLGKDIKVHIATGKISGKGREGSEFVRRIKVLLEKEFVELHENLSREAAISLMGKMDLVWCYRDPHLEDSTLELSTKLVETAALGKPCIVYGSEINKNFLGEDYPFLVKSLPEVSAIIQNYLSLITAYENRLHCLARKICKDHTFSAFQDSIGAKLDEDNGSALTGKNIVISGHDLKFIYPYITHLRRQGANAAIDPWEWGAHISLRLSEHYSRWGDYILCEWGLANSVWHSENKKDGGKLFVRVHAQEVRQRAAKFGRSVAADRVDKFVFVSPLIRKKALELFGWPEEKTEVIPNGVKENRFFDRSRAVKPILGMVGIVPTTKRLDRALDLLSALNERGWGATLYCKGHRPEDLDFMKGPGRKDELAYYEALYQRIESDFNLKGHVVFDKWSNDVEQWYQKIGFILSPSDNESFHYALADGVMAGCIPILWPWEGAEHVYTDDWIARDLDEAVKIFEKHMRSDTFVKKKILDNRQLVFRRYDQEKTFYLMDDLYRLSV